MDFVKLDESNRTAAIALMTQILLNKEPLLSFRQAPSDIARDHSEIVVNRAIHDEVSVVAMDIATNKVVGVMANFLVSNGREVEDIYAKCKPDEWRRPIFLLLDELGARFYQLEEVQDVIARGQKFMSVRVIVVSDGYHGRGIARRLLQDGIEMAKLKGAKLVYSILTSPISQHIFKTTPGFVQVGELVEYGEFQIDGVKPFAGMPPECKGAMLSMKRL